MTLSEARELTSLDRKIETVERLIAAKCIDAYDAQLDCFHVDMDVKTTDKKLEIAQDWLDWLVAL